MILWTAFGDYVDGLEPNLVAELVGLVVGVCLTYLILDRLLRRRLRARYEPMRTNLRNQIDIATAGMVAAWATATGVIEKLISEQARDTFETDDFLPHVLAILDTRRAPMDLRDEVNSRDPRGVQWLARAHVNAVERMDSAARHTPEFDGEDVGVRVCLAKLEQQAANATTMLEQWEDEESDLRGVTELVLVHVTRKIFRDAIALRDSAFSEAPA